MRVVLDTNAFYSDLGMKGPLRVLLDAARRREITLVVPDVVVREVLKRFRVRYREESRKLQGSAKRLSDMAVDDIEMPPLRDPDEAVVIYEAYLRTRLHDVGAVVALVPTVGHDEVLERAIERRKPFKESGAGYQDTLIWLTVLDEIEAGEVALITENTADFGDQEGEVWRLADQLRDDLRAAGHESSTVNLHTSLRAFIGSQFPTDKPEEADHDLDKVRALLTEDAETRSMLEREIAADLVYSAHWVPADLFREAEIEDVHVVDASVEALDVVSAYEFEEDEELYVLLVGRVMADVEFELNRREAEDLGREERALITTWGEDLVTGKTRAALDVDVEVVLSHAGEIREFEVVGADWA